jgi:5-methylcytosine-specific restriction endonuclease McrA
MGKTYEERREAVQRYNRQWMKNRRQGWIASQGPCVECGSTENLEVDHIDPSTKKYRPAALWGMAVDNPSRVAELAKCQILCRDCHKAKTRAYRKLHPIPPSKFSEEQIRMVRELRAKGWTYEQAGKVVGVSRHTASDFVNKSWQHIK